MYFDSLQSLFEMNGHGAYVWSAYAIGFIVLATLIWQPLTRHAQLKKDILRQLAEEQSAEKLLVEKLLVEKQ